MPFVWDCELTPEPPAKRRKLVSNMTRHSTRSSGDTEEQFLFEPADGPLESISPHEEEQVDEEKGTIRTSDREELIQCIKRGQKTTWIPKPGLEALCAEANAGQYIPSASKPVQSSHSTDHGEIWNFEAEPDMPQTRATRPLASDALRRSMSALRTDDAVHDYDQPAKTNQVRAETSTPRNQGYRLRSNASPPAWPAESPTPPSLPYQQSLPSDMLRRSRAPSLGSSLSSTFVMRIPTSPLVHATNNPTLDFSPRNQSHDGSGRFARRRTLPPHAFESLHMSAHDSGIPNISRPLPHGEAASHDDSNPLGHRPRRSLSSFTYQPAGVSQLTPWNRQRRSSLAMDTSPRQRASMVGSFEESILRGRMSAPASKPFDFVAQIGVMGKGNCPASLKCPAHVTVPFPAVFYNYPSAHASRSISDDHPSPYVGAIDLDHHLKAPEEPRRRTRRPRPIDNQEEMLADITKPENTSIGRALAKAAWDKQERASTSTKVPIGGAYRVPQKGQLQVIIKNPNKTAVKLFLIPYDLEGMLPGMKTFVRQRSYSSGPILGAATPEKSVELAARDPLSTKDILRYLIHIKFCCATKGRFYLYDTIRVVFANRVPDGQEKLRNEIQLPEPRFSAHKPGIGGHSRSSSIANDNSLLSRPLSTPDYNIFYDGLDPTERQMHRSETQDLSPTSLRLNAMSQYQEHAKPERWVDLPGDTALKEVGGSPVEGSVSPTPGFLPSTSARSSPVPWLSSSGTPLARPFSPTPVEAGHGLLSRKLREMSGSPEEPSN